MTSNERKTFWWIPVLLGLLAMGACDSPKANEVPAIIEVQGKNALDATVQQDGFFVAASLVLKERPTQNTPVLSDWDMPNQQRSFELGIDELQRPYLALSTDGKDSRVIKAHRSVPKNTPTVIAAEFRAGKHVRFFINGEDVNTVDSQIPTAIHTPSAQVNVARRANSRSALLKADVSHVVIQDAFSESGLKALVEKAGAPHAAPALAQVRYVKSPKGYAWFGYYDKLQIDDTGNLLLALRGEEGTENKVPQAGDVREVGYFDLRDDSWHPIATTRAWNWQQGSMLQWRPNYPNQIMFNDRDDGPPARFVTRIYDLDTKTTRTLPAPTYHVTNNGLWATGTDFARIDDTRRGYGYAGIPDPRKAQLAPAESTVYLMNLETGETHDLVNLAQIAAFPSPGYSGEGKKHYFNHLQFNPAGTRIMFLHRWLERGFQTRVFTVGTDGSDLKLVSAALYLSHYTWMDDTSLLIWTGSMGGYVRFFEDPSLRPKPILKTGDNGHQSFLKGDRSHIMVSDTYAIDGYQTLFQYDTRTDEARVLNVFYSPPNFSGEFRADLHPRVTADNRIVLDTSSLGSRQQAIVTLP